MNRRTVRQGLLSSCFVWIENALKLRRQASSPPRVDCGATLLRHAARATLVLTLLVAVAFSATALASDKSDTLRPETGYVPREQEIVPLSSADGWICGLSDKSSDCNQLESVKAERGILKWTLRRKPSVFNALVRALSLGDFQSIDFEICSQEATPIVVPVSDQDGAKFHYALNAEAGRWRHVHLTPTDFKPSDDSPVKKPSLDSSTLVSNFSVADLGGVFGAKNTNVIQLRSLVVQRRGLPTLNVPATISGRVVDIVDDCHIKTAVRIQNGAILRIRAKRVKLGANIYLEAGGVLDIAGTKLILANRFPHDLEILGRGRSLISMIRCQFMSTAPTTVNLTEASRLRISDTTFSGGGLTVGAVKGCIAELLNVKAPGEFVFEPGSRISLVNCDDALLWPWFGPPYNLNTSLPSGKSIAGWAMPASSGHNLSLKNCRGILWAGVVDKGANVTLKDSELRAIGLPLQTTAQNVSGLKNKAPLASLKMSLPDRNLTLNNCRVEAWNFYPGKQGRCVIDKCLFGEVIAFDESQSEIKNSTCDGSGGYVAAKDRSKLTLSNCIINSAVTSAGQATMFLRKCTVNGPLNATGSSTIHLIDTTVNGSQKQFDGGIILKTEK